VIEIRLSNPLEFSSFLQASDAYMALLYPAESNHMLDVKILLSPRMKFYGAYVDGVARGCGGFWMHDDYVEIKRVWVEATARGLGLSKRIMIALEDGARDAGYNLARLETGNAQPEALGLYRKLGYQERGPFGNYKPDPLSLFMEKTL
jgi:putative acetyltransferase